MPAEPQDRDPLEELAAEFVERHRCGQNPSIEEYAERHPHLAEDLRELLPAALAMEQLKAGRQISSGGAASIGPLRIERLGDLRIVREIGRGGMGVVYEAEQESLGRRVAVKVLPPQALADARHLARFHREARIASRLHHTNIVQVFGVGQQDGYHHYVMQFVQGIGLDRVIARLAAKHRGAAAPAGGSDPMLERICGSLGGTTASLAQGVARIGVQAAEALQYAHSHGTLHRDIKPANLLIDERGVVYVTDFGLARAVHTQEVTQPGDITGTLRYVPPERFAGRVGEAGDIYSLGLTLYELLALRPAYEDADRSRLVRRITQGDRPRPLRQVNALVPRDLETIIAKAAAHDVKHRYASAAELANDLQRFLEDRPITARRIGAAERLWRWARRNPAVASLSAATMLLLLAVAVVANIGYVRTRRALEGEAAQRRKADAVASLAQEALDRIFERLGPAPAAPASLSIQADSQTTVEVPARPRVSKEAAALLAEMLPFYDRLAAQSGENAALLSRAADANRRVGDIRQRLGQYSEAVTAYRKALDLYEQPAGRDPQVEARLRVARTYNELGQLYRTTRQVEEARQVHLAALAVLEPAAEAADAAAALRYELARTYYYLGTRVADAPGPKPPGGPPGRQRPGHRSVAPAPGAGLHMPGELPPGAPPLPEEVPVGPHPAGPQPGPPRAGLVERIVSGLPLLPPPPRRGGPMPDRRERRAFLEKAVGLLRELQAQQPNDPEPRRLLALCYRDSYDEALPADPVAAGESLGQAITLLKEIVAAHPHVADYRFDLCRTLATVDLRPPWVVRQDLAAAEGRLREALRMARELSTEYPDVPEYVASEAQIHHSLGIIYRHQRRFEEAEQSDRAALACQEALVRRVPDVAAYQVWKGAYSHSLADVLVMTGKPAEAQQLLEQSVEPLRVLLDEHPDMWYVHGLLGDMHRSLAEVHHRDGREEQARAARRVAEEHMGELRRHVPGRPGGPRPKGPPGSP